MTYETLTFDVQDNVGILTLNRPDNANALTGLMAKEMFDVSIRCENDPEVRAVLFTGAGKMFCAGGDLKEFEAEGDNLSAMITETAALVHSAVIRMQYMDAPVVIAVNGTAAGAGFSFALSGDIVLASEHAKFISAYTASGLTPDGSSTYFLAKHVGLLRAKELALTNRLLSAEEAVEWGIATRVVAADKLMDEAMELARTFAKGPTKAYGGTKRLALTAFQNSMEAQLEAETRMIASMTRTHDGVHGIQSFANKQKPSFKGE